MSKQKALYICSECGHEHLKWNGKCVNCGEWNTLEEFETGYGKSSGSAGNSAGLISVGSLSEINGNDEIRYNTGIKELNLVLGGGLVKGSLVLIAGDPGIGKSTLLLQICGYMGKENKVLYISGEESERQIKLRADRLKIKAEKLFLASSTDCEAIANTIKRDKPNVVIIDSIQTMTISGTNSAAGSVTQVRECTNLFMRVAKTEEIPIFIVGHVNKDGGIAGPKVLEHIVDSVLYFEGDRQLSYRILRSVKNRFGRANEIGVFEMQEKGLTGVLNPSEMLLSGKPTGISGISVLCAMEGSRPILAEIQALVSKTAFGQPRRMANGFDYNRLCLLLAVLEKRTGFIFGMFDVYLNIIGGLKIDEPAADAAIALALYSGLCDVVLSDKIAVFGEIGLGGEIRNVSHIAERVRECANMGFEKVIIPKAAIKSLDKSENYSIDIVGVSNLKQLFSLIGKVQ